MVLSGQPAEWEIKNQTVEPLSFELDGTGKSVINFSSVPVPNFVTDFNFSVLIETTQNTGKGKR